MESRNVPIKNIFFIDSLTGDAKKGGYDDIVTKELLHETFF